MRSLGKEFKEGRKKMFNKFKNKIRNMNINNLSKELQKRKELLFLWNSPNERHKAGVKGKNLIHPFYKIKKEIAIINTFIHQLEVK